ncbi:P-loop containing nucleoside triphosphate hydrolase protein, partial [Mycena rebaudengoi]
MLPPCPQIFHGRDSELHDTIKLLLVDSPRIAILGAGGMGKTGLATTVLHNSEVVAKHPCRYFVPCHSSSTCAQLVSTVADNIGVESGGSNLAQKIVHYLKYSPALLLVLDNLETPWESVSSQSDVEEFLSLLTDISHLGLIITMRGAERPAKVKWTRPFLPPLKPLSASAALETFIDVADNTHRQDSVKQLLEFTGNLPLAVNLIASVVSHEGCDGALTWWKSESTHMLSDGYDKRSSLDISIMLSFTSSRMTPGAQDLLSMLSILPDGLSDIDLVQAELPIADVLACKSTLIRTSLAFIDKDQRIKVLVPIREHTVQIHPPTSSMKQQLHRHFHDLLDIWNKFQHLNPIDIAPQIFHNLGNFNSVLEDAHQQFPDATQNIQSILFLNRFYHKTQLISSPLL